MKGSETLILRRYYKNIFVVIMISFLIFITYSQYKNKIIYESHISSSLNNDVQRLVQSIIDNQEVYDQILKSQYVTKGDAYFLAHNHSSLFTISQKYEAIAKKFERIEGRTTQNLTAINVREISFYFNDMVKEDRLDMDNKDDVIHELTNDRKEIITQLRNLNVEWLQILKHHIYGVKEDQGEYTFDSQVYRDHYGEHSISDDFWVKVVVGLDHKTKTYLNSQGFESIEEIVN